MAYLGEIIRILAVLKVAQKVAVFLDNNIRRTAQKVAQMAKNRPIWSH